MGEVNHQRVRELFHKAFDLPEGEREAFLIDECENDAVHREAVEELLRHHSAETLIGAQARDEKPFSHRDTPVDVSDQTQVEPTPPKRIARRFTMRYQREKRLAWIACALACVLLASLAAWVHRAIRESVRTSQRNTMQALLDEQVFSLRQWLASETELIKSWSRTHDLQVTIGKLKREAQEMEEPARELAASETRLQLRKIIHRLNGKATNIRYAVWNRDGMLIADSSDDSPCLGNTLTPLGGSMLSRVFDGKVVLWLPTTAGYITKGYVPPDVISKPGMSLIVPIYSASGHPRAIAGMMIAGRDLQVHFEELLTTARFGKTGEAYAIDRRGYLITDSRFGEQLRTAGLISAGSDSFSAQVVRVADPGGNIKTGHRPDTQLRDEWPLTTAAAAVIARRADGDFDGYVDYRGVEVVGVWKWLDEYEFGVIAEMDYESAFAPLGPLNRAYAFLLGVLALTTIGFTAVSLALVRARTAAGMATRIGPYNVEKKVGEGGLAEVFLATHRLLKRPTALKLLKPDVVSEQHQNRFEREVRIASSLCHPNTIEIYDYGRTPDGGFYAAMEYIDGLTLAEVVEMDGPQKPERVIWILLEVCRSLQEAHTQGLIHRDIKPHNLMLQCRAGEPDSVKVLDFGLARDTQRDRRRLTETKMLVGTPMYIAPERISDPTILDPRSDIFSLGVVAFFLLAGREPFATLDAVDALAKTMQDEPPRASTQASQKMPKQLDDLVSCCQSKNMNDRYASVDELRQRLEDMSAKSPWTRREAAQWWWAHAPAIAKRSQLGDPNARNESRKPSV